MSIEALIGVVVLVALGVWLFRPRRRAPREPWETVEPIDHAELEAAEREVRDAGTGPQPEEEADDDWGPGVPRPPGRP